jgi:hypothetical protein
MPPAFGVGEHCIGFHDVLEGRRALGTDAVGMIEFGQLRGRHAEYPERSPYVGRRG